MKKRTLYDTEELNRRADLLALVEHDAGEGKQHGAYVMFKCPLHADNKTPSLAVTPANGRWHCFGCKKSGRAIDWLIEARRLSFKQACEELSGGAPIPTTTERREIPSAPAYAPPGEAWQADARQVIEVCQRNLWGSAGRSALAYLRGRGLNDDTIRRFKLGYSPGAKFGDLDVYEGIVIPREIAGEIWALKIRRRSNASTKYISVTYSKPNSIFNADALSGARLALFCEGEFDCMLAEQELGYILPAVTLGSVSGKLDLASWGLHLLGLEHIFVTFDADEPGETGAYELCGLLGARAHLAPLPIMPEGKDITDYYLTQGRDLQPWIMPYLQTWCPELGVEMVIAGLQMGGVVTGISEGK